MKLYKLSKSRISFSLYRYFIKSTIAKNSEQLGVFVSTSKLRQFLIEQNIAKSPRVIFQKKIFNMYIEIYERVENARPLLSHDQKKFYGKVKEKLHKAKGHYNEVSWQAILKPEILKGIKRKSKIYKYMEDTLKNEKYFNTGVHGDLNPNNVMIDHDQNFWIVDWEGYSETGFFLWDIYFFYAHLKRSTPKPPDDIISIYNGAEKSDVKIKEMLLIYTLIKLRSDLLRHNRAAEIALESFFQRVSTIMTLFK